MGLIRSYRMNLYFVISIAAISDEARRMKKKGHPNIPDFSAKRVVPLTADTKVPKVQPPPPTPQQGVKPHATSKKSGRRGS
jgi:hypothetical protein